MLNRNHDPCSLFYIKKKIAIENGQSSEGEYTENVFGCPRVDFVIVGESNPPRVSSKFLILFFFVFINNLKKTKRN